MYILYFTQYMMLYAVYSAQRITLYIVYSIPHTILHSTLNKNINAILLFFCPIFHELNLKM